MSADAALTLTALIGSRICHDLISPLGAVSNGLELLEMAGGAAGPEIALIEESVANANARIRFFRVAFGQAGAEARIGAAEITAILQDLTRGGRTRMDWQLATDVARREAKLAFLVLLCCESALAYGGTVEIGCTAGAWQARAQSERLRADPALWALLGGEGAVPEGAAPGPEVTPAQAQFLLAPAEAAAQGRRITARLSETEILISW